MRYRPGAHRSFRPRHRHWLRGLMLAVLVLAVLFLLYGCAVQRLIYSSRGTMIFLPERPLNSKRGTTAVVPLGWVTSVIDLLQLKVALGVCAHRALERS